MLYWKPGIEENEARQAIEEAITEAARVRKRQPVRIAVYCGVQANYGRGAAARLGVEHVEFEILDERTHGIIAVGSLV